MKKTGLSNRFDKDKAVSTWEGWHYCLICTRNRWDALHHIISPSSRHYVKGEHNKSMLNSCPIHNYGCHIGNESYLYSDKTIKKLLKTVKTVLESRQYRLDDTDKAFLKVYNHLYE